MRLDRAATSSAGRAYKRDLLVALDLRRGHIVVDIGCGPGTDLGDMAAAGARVIGVDDDPAMLAVAVTRHPQLELRAGDAHALPLADRSADRVRLDRVLQHLADPAAVLREVGRVLRPDGLAALADPDWETLAIDDEDLQTSRAYTRYVAARVVRNASIGRGWPGSRTVPGCGCGR